MNMSADVQIRQEPHAWFIQISGELTVNESDLLAPAKPWAHPADDVAGAVPESEGASASESDSIRSASTVVFDLTSMHYCNSAGIALLIRYVREAQNNGYNLAAFGVSPHYQKIFRIVGLTQYLELFPDGYSVAETLRAREQYSNR